MANTWALSAWSAHNWRWVLVLSCLPLFAHETAFTLAFAVMMLAGIIACCVGLAIYGAIPLCAF